MRENYETSTNLSLSLSLDLYIILPSFPSQIKRVKIFPLGIVLIADKRKLSTHWFDFLQQINA